MKLFSDIKEKLKDLDIGIFVNNAGIMEAGKFSSYPME